MTNTYSLPFRGKKPRCCNQNVFHWTVTPSAAVHPTPSPQKPARYQAASTTCSLWQIYFDQSCMFWPFFSLFRQNTRFPNLLSLWCSKCSYINHPTKPFILLLPPSSFSCSSSCPAPYFKCDCSIIPKR